MFIVVVLGKAIKVGNGKWRTHHHFGSMGSGVVRAIVIENLPAPHSLSVAK
jgi:cobalamin biosynthesis protein CbiD